MNAAAWVCARPIAHRGLHGAPGIIENSASAARAAIAAGYAIECDVQLSADGEAMVFHDYVLDRLTPARGRVDSLPAARLAALPLGEGPDRIMTLSDLIGLVDGRTTIVCELKSRFDHDPRLARRVAEIAAAGPARLALKSFDPEVVAILRSCAPALGLSAPLGIVAMADFHDPSIAVDAETKRSLDAFLHWERSRPDFLSFCVDDLPHAAPALLRAALGVPTMAWTVRRRPQLGTALAFADQVIFEGDVLAHE